MADDYIRLWLDIRQSNMYELDIKTTERTTHMFQISKKRIPGRTAYSLLLDDIEKARYDLALAYDNFENAMDPDLIDYCIYQVNAMHMRYKFLLSEAKQLNQDNYAKNPLELSEP